VVGIDGSAPARRALIVAAEEARLRGAALHAAHGVRWDHLGGELLAPATRELVAWGRELVATELAETDIAARCVVVPGHAADVLVGQSAQADLLVVGHRGHRRPPGLLLGSIADHCARHAHCPVMIVRAEHPGP
jgi:nucleotide-binding universal stress UspA family protein